MRKQHIDKYPSFELSMKTPKINILEMTYVKAAWVTFELSMKSQKS